MKYIAKILSSNPLIEEELSVDIEGVEISCFVEEYKCDIEYGEKYIIDLELVILDDLDMKEIITDKQSVYQINESFSYLITGKFLVDTKQIESKIFFSLEDEEVSDYWYLENKNVEIRVDRINISVIEKYRK